MAGTYECFYPCIESDHDLASGAPLARGWCQKHGTKARLMRPKTGKAALHAENLGQGREVQRGRNAFSRSAGKEKWSSYIRSDQRHKQISGSYGRMLRRSGKEAIQICPSSRNAHAAIRFKPLSDLSGELDLYHDDLAADADWHSEAAMHEIYPALAARTMRNQGSVDVKTIEGDELFERLQRDVLLKLKTDEPFVQLQRRFFLEHGKTAYECLRCCFAPPKTLDFVPTEVSEDVQRTFLNTYSKFFKGTFKGTLRPAFHGTARRNLGSIMQRGLLIPGQGNTLPVVHGSAAGLGIYTAVMSPAGAQFSHGFCEGGPMLLCAVLDDSQLTKVWRVRDAMVVFDTRRVVPLFRALARDPPQTHQKCAVRPLSRKAAQKKLRRAYGARNFQQLDAIYS